MQVLDLVIGPDYRLQQHKPWEDIIRKKGRGGLVEQSSSLVVLQRNVAPSCT